MREEEKILNVYSIEFVLQKVGKEGVAIVAAPNAATATRILNVEGRYKNTDKYGITQMVALPDTTHCGQEILMIEYVFGG